MVPFFFFIFILFYLNPSSPGLAVSLSVWLSAALSRHGAGQRSGQQHLPEKSGPQWEQHGRHRSQDAQQSPADQHHTQVKERAERIQLFLCFYSICILCIYRMWDLQPCPAGVWHGIATTPLQQDFWMWPEPWNSKSFVTSFICLCVCVLQSAV